MDKSDSEVAEIWPDIDEEERIQHELLFYSQGPVNGYLLGEKARDLFLHSRLPLTVLSKIWNLADISHDNLLSVEEFVLVMHLINGILHGRKVPLVLPENIVPKKPSILQLPAISDREKDAYNKIFQTYDSSRKGHLQGSETAIILKVSKLPPEQLACVWNWCDVNRDGQLDLEEWTVACHLLCYLKKGNSLDVTFNPYEHLPHRLSPTSLQARKLRVEEYERHKQRLMLLKEKRKLQITREAKRLELLKEKSQLEKKLFESLKSGNKGPVNEEEIQKVLTYDKDNIEKLEEIVVRLKKEHEKVRQETVKVILGEQKLHFEHSMVKKETDELNKRLETQHSKATRDPDPFHQLYEQRKEERKKSNLSEGEEPEIHLPFKFNPFEKESLHHSSISGSHLFLNSHSDNNNSKVSVENQTLFSELNEFNDEFIEKWSSVSQKSSEKMEEEEDNIFMTVEVKTRDDCFLGVNWQEDSIQGIEDASFISLHRKLVDLRSEMHKLNQEAGGKMIFRNPSDYLARKKEKEEEEQKEKSKYPRRSKSSADKDYASKRRSYIIDRKNDETETSDREKRFNRRSLNLDHISERGKAPERPQQPQSRVSDSHGTREQRRRDRPLSVEVTVKEGTTKSTSPTTSPNRLSSTKKTRAPPPPCSPISPDSSSAEVRSGPASPVKESKIPVLQSSSKDTPRRPPRRKGSSSSKPTEDATDAASPKETHQGRSSFLFGAETDIHVPTVESDKRDTPIEKEKNIIQEVPQIAVEVKKDIVVQEKKLDEQCIEQSIEQKVDGIDQNISKSEQINYNEKTEFDLAKKDNSSESSEKSVNLIIPVENISVELKTEKLENQSNPDDDQISIPESLDLKKETPPQIARDNLSLDIPSSDTVSLCSVDSIPPELPHSEPPKLSSSLLNNPNGPQSPIEEEIVEIVTTPRTESTPSVISKESSNPSFTEFKSDFILEKSEQPAPVVMEEVAVADTNGNSLDTFVNDLAIEVKMSKVVDSDEDSDLSDIENQNGSFSPGDSSTGHVPTAVDNDAEEDDEIQLISFNNTATSIQSPNSQTDSAFEDMMSSMHSNDPENGNQVSLGNTLDDFQDDIVKDTVVVTKVVEVESTPEENPPLPDSPPPAAVEVTRVQLKDERLKDIQMKREPVTFVKKAQQFSEIVNEPPKVRIRATTKEMSDAHLQEVDRERKAVISQSMVKRREVGDASKVTSDEVEENKPSVDLKSEQTWNSEVTREDTEVSVVKSLNSSVNWEEKPPKVDLYSKNVIQENDTSESVDRESIADLSSTRQQWESLFKASSPVEPANKPVPKKTASVKHWEVKLPYKPVNSSQEITSPSIVSEENPGKMDTDAYANESAIEREIRLANEREEMLRKEQEERSELIKRQNASKNQINTSVFEPKEDNNNTVSKAMYHEMTEADRGSELQMRETMIQQEIEQQKEREIALKPVVNTNKDENVPDKSTESLIAREIRLQKEREEEIANRHRKEVPEPEVVVQKEEVVLQETVEMPSSKPQTNGLPSRKDISYEEAIGTYQHEGESLIARELREAREREEELQRLRSMSSMSSQKPVQKEVVPTQQSTPKGPQKKVWQAPSPSVHTPTMSSQNVSRNVKVTPIPDSDANSNDVVETKPRKETPIEREIRIARERENELRRSKGLPEIAAPVKENNVESAPPASSEPVQTGYRSRLRSEESSHKLKQYATSQLQRELKSQKEKEMTLRNEGKIISTSEEHIGTLKYTDLAVVQQSDVPVKRNFVTRKSVSSMPLPSGSDSPGSSKTPSENGDIEQSPPQPSVKEESRYKRSLKTGGANFSYKESSHKAESKIEKELREMREREEELKQERERAGILSPDNTDSPRDSSFSNRKAQFEQST